MNLIPRWLTSLSTLPLVMVWLVNVLVTPAAMAHDVPAEMVAAATRFLSALDNQQREQVVIKFDTAKRKAWHYFPSSMMEARGGRRGLALKQMTPAQRALAHGLVNSALSHKGYLTSMTIMALESILRELELGNPIRDPEMYHVAVYGTPSVKKTWGWSFEGHHLSVNVTLVDGQRFCVTPSFFGSNPAIVPSGAFQGLDTLAAEQQLGRELAESLTAAQRRLAFLADKSPKDIVSGAQPAVSKDQFHPSQGIAFEQLNVKQQELLRKLVAQFVEKYRRPIVDQVSKRAEVVPGPGTFFAWAGSLQKGKGHYYRVQTPHYLFEYDNTQNKANHIHTVWREFDGDFGADLLRQHYQNSPHHQQDRANAARSK